MPVIFRSRELTIDYAERGVSLAGCPVPSKEIEHLLLIELLVHPAGCWPESICFNGSGTWNTLGTLGRFAPRSRAFHESWATTLTVRHRIFDQLRVNCRMPEGEGQRWANYPDAMAGTLGRRGD